MVQLHRDALAIDPAEMTERIVAHLRESVYATLRRKGAVVGLSGGVDSSVVLALCVRAFGAGKVVGLLLQEKESSPENAVLARKVSSVYGVTPIAEDITAPLEGFGCY